MSGSLESTDDAMDQMATSSFIKMRNLTRNNSTLERPLMRDVDITTIRYENSNGFVPITPEAHTVTTVEETSYAENLLDRNFSSEKHLSLFIKNPDDSMERVDEPLERNPFYSSEARIFLSLTKPFSNRRSSNARDSTDDFELLKINDDTPSVASYQNFYNSLNPESSRSSRDRETGTQNLQREFYEDQRTQNMDKINVENTNRGENYPLNNQNNPATEDQRNAASGASHRYYSYSQMNEGRNNVNNGYSYPKSENIDYNSKMNDNNSHVRNFQQQNYDRLQGYRHLININNNNDNQQNSQITSQPTDITFRQKHPSKQNSKFVGKQNPTARIKPSISQNGGLKKAAQNLSPSPRQEEAVSYFEHAALFNRDESVDKTGDEDASDENYEYVEVTEKPKRFRKQRKRPSQSSRDSGRLPKEHRDFEEEEESSSGKRKTRFRQKTRSNKIRGNSWLDDEDESGEEDFDSTAQGTVDSENRNRQRLDVQNRRPKENTWSNVSPNVEISHSSGIEIDEIGKPKLVLPVKVNLLPVANFDHRTALGNSQGFDISNAVLHNFVTATPITFGTIRPVAGIANTPQNIFGQNVVKTLQNLQNQNLKVQTSAPDVIVGQNAFHNSVQTILMPQVSPQNYQTQFKLAQNERNAFPSNGQNSFPQNPNPSFNLLQHQQQQQQQQNPPTQNVPTNSPVVQNPVYIPNQNMAQSFQNFHLNQVQNQGQSNLQTNDPHPTPQTFENYQQQTSSYNVQVNPRGLQGHSLPANQNLYTPQSAIVFPTTPIPIFVQSGNIDGTSSQGKRNFVSGSNGQFLASASLTVGEQTQNQISHQNLRPQQTLENYQQSFRQDNVFPKIKTFNQIAEASQAPLNSNGQQQFGRDNQAEQFSQASNAIAQTYKDQNQQILKVANEIFESTLERLKQLQKNQNFRPSRPESSQNLFGQDIAAGLRETEPRVQNTGVKNVEIVTPNSFSNPFENSNGFNGLSLTTPFPIFATTGFDPSLRSPIGQASSINGYVNSLTEIGAKGKDLKTSSTTSSWPNSSDFRFSPVLFNPINFVPNLETLKNQNTLNSKHSNGRDTPFQGLNLVPIIPGGNFYKHSYNAQEDLFSKPKLSSDLQKYAEEMFKESLRTMYNTQKWNNDHKAQSSEISSVTTSPQVKDELRNLKFSAPDIKPSKQILEAHYTESGAKDADIQSQKKLPSKIQDLGEILKPDFNLPPPIAFEPVKFYYKPNIHLTRPTMSDLNNPDFKFESDFGGADYIHDFLIPPKPNAFISKSPFNDGAPKRRPRPKKPTSDPEKVKFSRRPEPSSPRPSSTGVVETASSNIAHYNFPFDTPRQEFLYNRPSFDQEDSDFDPDHQNSHSLIRGNNFQSRYPSLTTSYPLAEDSLKPSFQKYDFNHPRMHNLMGLLRKNKRLPAGRSQNYFEKKEDMEVRFEDRKPRERSLNLFKDESSASVENNETGLNLTRTIESS